MQLNNDVATGLAAHHQLGGAVAGDNTFCAGRQRTFGAGLNYAFGPATVGFVFTQTKLDRCSRHQRRYGWQHGRHRR